MDDGAVEGDVPVQIVDSQGADGADDRGSGVLEDGGETGDTGFGDSFENHTGVREADLGAGAVEAVGDLDTERGGGGKRGVVKLETGEGAIGGDF